MGYLNSLGMSTSNAPGVGNFLLCFFPGHEMKLSVTLFLLSKIFPRKEICGK